MNVYYDYDKLYSAMRRLTPNPMLQFETNLVNHCNLNCRSCDHISPISEKWFADIEKFDRNLSRLSSIFNGEAKYIRLVGGEPLLHPKLIDFFRVARANFISTDIQLWSNGILLPKMGKIFWEECHRQNIHISITKYPISVNYDLMRQLAEDNGVNLSFFDNGNVVDEFNNNSYDVCGRFDPKDSYLCCPNANRHITLTEDGRLFTCDKPPHISILNEYFGVKFKISSMDYIDIFSNISAREVLKFLAAPIPFCRYCNIRRRERLEKWAQSENKMAEWIFYSEE